MYLDALYSDCYQVYENEMKMLEVNPRMIVDQADPQQILDDMKEKALKKVGSAPKIGSSFLNAFQF